jgi:PIN domain nuclease of toxin-antitoxin system
MKLLLDTHVFVWWRDEPSKLSTAAFDHISDFHNEVFISVVSAWELQIKIALNKLKLKWPLGQALEVEQSTNGFRVLPIMLPHVMKLDSLSQIHKDPFDRLLIAQADFEHMTIITADVRFSDYNAKVLW